MDRVSSSPPLVGVLMSIAGGAVLLVASLLPETWPKARRMKLRPLGILLTYGRLLRMPGSWCRS